jgi:mRNA interferase HigB
MPSEGSVRQIWPYAIFDVGGNNHRVMTVIHYNRQRVYILHVIGHRR